MALRVESFDGTAERIVLCGMATSRLVLAPVAARWSLDLFASRLGKLIGGWCVEYFAKHNRPPGAAIRDYFDRWASTADREAAAEVATFLEGLSAEAARLRETRTPDHVLDLAGEFFNRTRLRALRDGIDADLSRGDVPAADARVEASRKIELGMGAGIDVLGDDAAWEAMYARRVESIVQYPDGLGEMFGGALSRDALVAFLAPEKRGKSFFLHDLAWRAVEQGLRVAYFEVGDSTQPQVLRRWAARMIGRPIFCGPRGRLHYSWPLSIMVPEDRRAVASVETEDRFVSDDVSLEQLKEARQAWVERVGANAFRLSCHPNTTLTVAASESIMDAWERDDFCPDVVLYDYADILAPPPGIRETRDQHNANWKALRAVSQKRHCLVVTATQSDADSYDDWILTRRNFSEDKRKYAHATAFFGINQTPAEKEVGVYRVNTLMARDQDVDESRCCYAAGCIAASLPLVVSAW